MARAGIDTIYTRKCTQSENSFCPLGHAGFFSDITYHTISDFPVSISFYTLADAYDIIYATPEKEIVLNHALSHSKSGTARRLVIVEKIEQIPLLSFPDITAFCQVFPDGRITYYKKQGDSLFDG